MDPRSQLLGVQHRRRPRRERLRTPREDVQRSAPGRRDQSDRKVSGQVQGEREEGTRQMSHAPSERQIDYIAFIAYYLTENGKPPTLREMALGLDVVSKGTLFAMLNSLVKSGFIVKTNHLQRKYTLSAGLRQEINRQRRAQRRARRQGK